MHPATRAMGLYHNTLMTDECMKGTRYRPAGSLREVAELTFPRTGDIHIYSTGAVTRHCRDGHGLESMREKQEVTIAGAGPAGLAAAIVLARHGRAVRVYEKRPEVGGRFRGDHQGIENWSTADDVLDDLRQRGLNIDSLCVPFSSGTVYAPGMRPVEVSSRRPIFYLVRRGPGPGTLDRGLREQALALGVEILTSRFIMEPREVDIAATGPVRADVLAFGVTFDTLSPDHASVVFDDALTPNGYGYCIIFGGRGTVASVHFRDFRDGRRHLHATVDFFRSEEGLHIQNVRGFAGFGNFFIADALTRERTMFAGEAAGLQDFLWGFGMRYAMVSGCLAAESILQGEDYNAMCRRVFGKGVDFSFVNRYLFERLGRTGYRYLARRLGSEDVRAYLSRLYRTAGYKRALLSWVSRRVKGYCGVWPPRR